MTKDAFNVYALQHKNISHMSVVTVGTDQCQRVTARRRFPLWPGWASDSTHSSFLTFTFPSFFLQQAVGVLFLLSSALHRSTFIPCRIFWLPFHLTLDIKQTWEILFGTNIPVLLLSLPVFVSASFTFQDYRLTQLTTLFPTVRHANLVDTFWAGFWGLIWRKFFWDFVGGTLRDPGGMQ